MRVLAVVAVVAVVVAGIWVTGGLISNEFRVSMVLTAAWMGLAGLVCLAVAVRHRRLRWPVLGAYVLTAAVAGVYLGSSQLFDRTVVEPVAVAAAPEAAMAAGAPAERRNTRLASGRLEPVRHRAAGTATAIE